MNKRKITILFFLIILTAATLVTSISVFAYPDWYDPDFSSGDLFHNDPSVPRLIDDAGIFSSTEFSKLKSQLSELKTKHDADFVVVTVKSLDGLSYEDFTAEYYDQHGYGVGDDYSGVIMVINFGDDRGWWTFATGKCEKYFTESNVNTMDDTMEPYMIDGDYYTGISKYFEKTDELLTYGKFKKTPAQILKAVLIAAVPALIVGLILLSSATASMKAVSTAVKADQYLDAGVSAVNNNDEFINSTVTRVYSPIERGSSRSSGGSSYSGGHHSSGGHSFSGGGRRF